MESGIYVIKNIITEKVYIGSAINLKNRWYTHKSILKKNKHSNRKLQSAWNFYGEQSFEFIVVEIVIDKNKLIEIEQQYLNNFLFANLTDNNRFESLGYNIRRIAESNLGYKASIETRRKMSEAAKGKKKKPMSEETKQKLSDSQKGKSRKFSKEHLEYLRNSGWKKGQKHSEEHRKNISKGLKGKSHTKERVDFRKQFMQGINSNLTIENVMQIKEMLLQGYKNVDIAKQFEVGPGTISDIKRGKTFKNIKHEFI